MEPQIKVWVEEGGRTVFGDQEVRVLEAIAARGTLADVAASLGMSYRGLWGKLKEMEANLGTKLVQSTVGGSGGGTTQLTHAASASWRCTAASAAPSEPSRSRSSSPARPSSRRLPRGATTPGR